MTKKIFRSIYLTVLVAVLLCFFTIFWYSYDVYTDQMSETLSLECEYMRAGYEAFGEEFFSVISKGDLRVSWIDENGNLLYDSRIPDGQETENHMDREEVIEALNDGAGYATRYSSTISELTAYCALRANDGTVIRVSNSQNGALGMLLYVSGPVVIIFIITLAVALLVARKLAFNIVRPINEIDLEHPEDANVYVELGPIVDKLSSQNYKISRQVAELKMRENEFNSITLNMSEGMLVINSRAAILSCNKSARNIFGVKDTPKSVLSLNNSPTFREAIIAALGGKTGYDVIKTEDKHYSLIATPVYHEGRVEGAVIVIIDDTEKEEREGLRREFTSNVSHELKTPLTSISGFAELIESGMADGEDARRFAGNIRKESARLISLVGDIIRLSQLDGGEIPYDGCIELYSVAEEVVARLENVAQNSDVALSLSGGRAYAEGNRLILEEMIYNLCDNAIKYNLPGGKVEVVVSVDDGGAPFVSVRDNGIGIPKDKQDRVFERFYRVDKSHSKNIGGTGLGLSIVKHAAAYHKAKIDLVSDVGVGTSITVSFVSCSNKETADEN